MAMKCISKTNAYSINSKSLKAWLNKKMLFVHRFNQTSSAHLSCSVLDESAVPGSSTIELSPIYSSRNSKLLTFAMARTAERNKIWVRPFATSVKSKRLNVEDAYVCVDEEVRQDEYVMSNSHCITKNVHDKPAKVAEQLVECDMELREEYKQLLVQAVAERKKRKITEVEMWKEIEKETGFNHKIVWDEIREITIKKIMSLLLADDLVENISKEMQLSPTDWLLFDLLLVHEKINVLNVDPLIMPPDPIPGFQGNARKDREEPQCLEELFELVKQYDIENMVGEALAVSWTRLTLQYNSRGRQCSQMMLQLRWYQMKELTRSRFYNSYVYSKHQDIQKKMQSNEMHELTVLQNAIAVAYHTIITEELPTWETLIEQERVILCDQFTCINLVNTENNTDSGQALSPSNKPLATLIKVDEKQISKINKAEGNIVTEGAINFDLKNDVTDIKALEESKEQFKLRLIREMAKTIWLPEKHTWQRLNKELGRECKMWNRMRNATAKKVTNLLAVNDVITGWNGSTRMQLSVTDWLLFDLVLVHEKINVLRYDKLESQCLRDLVKLIQEYDVENRLGEDLVEAWINVTLKYNTGGRQCSPMLLQLRWHQLKEMSRQQIYKPSLLLNRNKTKILRAIVAKYQKIITQKWLQWNTLIQNKSVILSEDFITIIQQKKKWSVLEPREAWYLHVNDVIGHCDTMDKIKGTAEKGLCIVPDVLQPKNVDTFNEILEQTPKDSNQLTISKLNETKEPEIIELDSDDEINEILREKANYLLNTPQEKIETILSMPKIMSISGAINKNTINKKPVNCDSADGTVLKPVFKTSINNNESKCNSDDEMDKLLQEKANLISIKLPKNPKTENLTGNAADESAKVSNSNIYEMEVEESGIIKKERIIADTEYESLDEVDFDENNIEFVDDGIKFEEGGEYNITKNKLQTGFSSDSDDNSNADENDDESHIDLKLLMNTTVETKKIDCMEVFKFIDYNFVNDKRVIEYAELESKPRKSTPKAKDVESFRNQAIPRCEKYTNQLDEYKALAKTLLNETMCSKRSDLKSAQANEVENTDNHIAKITVPSIPDTLTEDQNTELAKHVRDLIATISADEPDESDVMSSVIPNLAAKRSKVINLPDKEQIRLINQSLLTAEITPRHQPTINLPAVNTENSIKSEPVRTIYPSEETPCKRLKTDSETSQLQSPIASYYCCWAREKIVHTDKKWQLECSPHTCHDNHCTCCCRLDLISSTSENSSTNMPSSKCPNLPKAALPKSPRVYGNPTVNVNTSVKTEINCDKSVGCSKLSDILLPDNQNSVNIENSLVKTRITNTRIPIKNSILEGGSNLARTQNTAPQKVLNYTIDTDTDTSLLRKNVSPSTKASTSRDKVSATNTPELVKIASSLPVNQASAYNFILVPPGVNFVQIDDKLALAINPGVKLPPDDLQSLMSVCALANDTQ